MEAILKCKNINKSFGRVKALKEVNLKIYPGDIYGLIGPNGAGKSTIIKLIASWMKPDSGEIEIFGKVGDEAFMELKNMGFLIDDAPFYDYLKCIDNLEIFSKLKNMDLKTAYECLEKFKMDSKLNRKVKDISTGERKALGISVAVMNRPSILILDEPVNGLDPEKIVILRNFLLEINKNWNTTILISSHLLNELSIIATRYGFIKDGQIIEELTREELEKKSQNYIYLKLEREDVFIAVAKLEERFKDIRYKVYPDAEIRIYDEIDTREISKYLMTNDIFIKAIEKRYVSLEEYYVNMVGEKNA